MQHSTGSRLTGPGVFRLYLAALVVLQHLDILGLGATAVHLFFAMSGYWITNLWNHKYRRCERPYLTFLCSRYWRLFPLYFVCVTLMSGVWLHFSPKWSHHFWAQQFSATWLARALLIASSNSQPSCLVPTWSLDIEMQYYFVAPLLAFLFAFFAKRRVLPGFAIPFSAACLSAYLFLPGLGMQVTRFLFFFVLGCWIQQTKWRPSAGGSVAGIALFLGITGLLLAFPQTRPILGTRIASNTPRLMRAHEIFSLVAVGALVPALAYCLGQHSDKLDRTLGELAYPVYLFHLIPIEAVARMPRVQALGPKIYVPLELLVILVGALLLFFLVDRPLERMRRKFVNGRLKTRDSELGALELPVGN